jgi:porphobilinogen synthase
MHTLPPPFPVSRLRRLRRAEWSRRLVRETRVSPNDLIWAIVVHETDQSRIPVASMPGADRLSVEAFAEAAMEAERLGIPAIALFPNIAPSKKNACGDEGLNPDGVVCRAIRAAKAVAPSVGVMADVALDPYTDHGHDGVMKDGRIVNDETVARLVEQALVLAEAGADIIAPSDMMDGRVGAIRQALEGVGKGETLIMSYAAKYASALYAPFRDAVGSAAALQGDKKTYQMDFANAGEALRECALDVAEGADMLLVKPGLPYLDIVHRVKSTFAMPTFAYQVSGEYAMMKAAAVNGWLDEERAVTETLTAFKRAGCDGIITYYAPLAARLFG